MLLKNIDNKIFSYKTLSIFMVLFGSFLITFGGGYAYFIAKTVGVSQLDQVTWTFFFATCSVPAGIFICIVGKNLKEPIIKNKNYPN